VAGSSRNSIADADCPVGDAGLTLYLLSQDKGTDEGVAVNPAAYAELAVYSLREDCGGTANGRASWRVGGRLTQDEGMVICALGHQRRDEPSDNEEAG
jgi:hypothetical protein